MSWSRRRLLAGLGPSLLLGCAGGERRPPRISEAVEVELPVVVDRALELGPRLYLLEEHALPLVAVAVAVPAGHQREPVGQAGVARLAGKMLLEGIDGGDRRGLLDRYADLGATPELQLGPAQVVVRCVVHRDDGQAALDLLLQTLRSGTFDARAFERVRLELRESLLELQGSPDAVATMGLVHGVFGTERPSEALGQGTRADLAALTVEQARAFITPHVRPGSLTVLLAGDVELRQAKAWIEAGLRGWSAAAGSPGPAPSAPASAGPGPRGVLVPWEGLEQSIVAFGGPREPYGAPEQPAQAVAEAIMSGMVNYELRTKQRTSYGVLSRIWRTRYGALEQMWTRVEPEDVDHALLGLQRDFEWLIDGMLSERAVAEARLMAMVDLMEGFHGAERGLQQLIRLAGEGLPASAAGRRLEALRALDMAGVMAVLREDYHPDAIRYCVVADPGMLERAAGALPREGVVIRTREALLGEG